MRLVNCTAHNVGIVKSDGDIVDLPPSGAVLRCRQVSTPDTSIEVEGVGSVSLVRLAYGEIDGAPEQIEGTMYVVSAICQNAAPDRNDFLTVTDLVRNETGRPVGARSLARPG